MSNYTSPDAHNVILDFNDAVTGTTNLNFKDSASSNIVNALVSLKITSQIHGKQGSEAKDRVLAHISTRIRAKITGKQSVNYLRKVRAVVNTGLMSLIDGHFDINFIVGVSGQFGVKFQKAFLKSIQADTPWAKPIFKNLSRIFSMQK